MSKGLALKIPIICGPTGVGKTALALELAEKKGCEIVSVDSGQVYKELNIGTAKPTLEEQKRIPFHLIDIIDPNQKFSAADFVEKATWAIGDIQKREQKPLLVGGTGLYFKTLEKGLFEGPSKSEEIRRKLEERIQVEGLEALHAELIRIDPEAAQTIPPQNRQRIIRALEVYEITGKTISSFWKEHAFQEQKFSFLKIGLTLPREELYQRADQRIDHMIQNGLFEEVTWVLKKWGREAPGLQLIGYKEVVMFLTNQLKKDEAVTLLKKNTHHYIKRQMTWFRKDPEIFWVKPEYLDMTRHLDE